MLRHQFILFFRHFQRQRLFGLINILGLSAGVCGSLLIYLYVSHELSYDTFHEKGGRLYRVNQTFIWGEDPDQLFSSTGPGVLYALQEELPELEAITRVHTPGSQHVQVLDQGGERRWYEEAKVLAADSNFFDLFTFAMKAGNPETALQQPRSVVLTRSTALKYFGQEDPLGKVLQVGVAPKVQAYQVTGVLEDLPTNSYLQFDLLFSMNSFPQVKARNRTWIWTGFVTFALLKESASIESVREKLKSIPRNHVEETLKQVMGMSFDEYIARGKKWELRFQPFLDIRLHSSDIHNRLNETTDAKTVYALIGAAIFILLLSCVNFVNLSMAQYLKQSKAVGIRKILGSSRRQLSGQYLLQTGMFCLMALVLGGMFTELLLGYFNELLGTELRLNLSDGHVWGILLALMGSISLLSGSYPALMLSAFPPMEALKGRLRSGKGGGLLRNGMMGFQFAVSLMLISCTLVVYQQLRFASEKDLGFDREHLLTLQQVNALPDHQALLNELRALPGISSASYCSAVPPEVGDNDQFRAEGAMDQSFALVVIKGDEAYHDALGLDLLLGRGFSKAFPRDSQRVILNKTALESLGWEADESVLGKKIYHGSPDNAFEVVGVVDDFHHWSLHTRIEPLAIFHPKGNIYAQPQRMLALKVDPMAFGGWEPALAQLETAWQEHAHGMDFSYEFVDEAFAQTFAHTQRFGQLLGAFASLAIFIACLGLLGMIIYSVEQRTREIGIRKVVGANFWHIAQLLGSSYAGLFTASMMVALPISAWLMQQWLQDFEYRIQLSPWPFLLTAALVLGSMILIGAPQLVRASSIDPAKVLRDE